MMQATRANHGQRRAVMSRPRAPLVRPIQLKSPTSQSATFFDLGSQPDVRRLQNPELALSSFDGLVIIEDLGLVSSIGPWARTLMRAFAHGFTSRSYRNTSTR